MTNHSKSELSWFRFWILFCKYSGDPKSDHSKTQTYKNPKHLKTRRLRRVRFSNGQPPFETQPTFNHSNLKLIATIISRIPSYKDWNRTIPYYEQVDPEVENWTWQYLIKNGLTLRLKITDDDFNLSNVLDWSFQLLLQLL